MASHGKCTASIGQRQTPVTDKHHAQNEFVMNTQPGPRANRPRYPAAFLSCGVNAVARRRSTKMPAMLRLYMTQPCLACQAPVHPPTTHLHDFVHGDAPQGLRLQHSADEVRAPRGQQGGEVELFGLEAQGSNEQPTYFIVWNTISKCKAKTHLVFFLLFFLLILECKA